MIRRTTLIALAVVGPLAAQDDWTEAVAKANEHHRYAVRRAVSNKIAKAGDEAVPAIESFVEARGANSLTLLVVDAISRSDAGGAATIAMLEAFARDRDFFWRAQALSGLARRGVERPELYDAALVDPSHLFRIEGCRGLLALGGADRVARVHELCQDDPDPRARLRIACLLVDAGELAALDQVVAAFDRDQLVFLGDPWGERDTQLAVETLTRAAGEDFGWRDARTDATSRLAAFQRMAQWASDEVGRELTVEPAENPHSLTGGIEVRSCRNGDLFVRWGASGIRFGLIGDTEVSLPAESAAELVNATREIRGDGVLGRVVCDYLRLREETSQKHVKAAPGAWPRDETAWIERLTSALREAGHEELANAVLARTPQFVEAPPK